MNKFLDKINASVKLKFELSKAKIKVINNPNNNNVKIIITSSQRMNAKSNIEFYSSTNNLLKESDCTLREIHFDFDFSNDLFYTYENIVQYIKYIDSKINLSNIILKENSNKFLLVVSDPNIKNMIEENKDDISNFLIQMFITNKEWGISLDENLLNKNKIMEIVKKEEIENFEKEEILDESIRSKYKKIDFSITERQHNVYYEGFIFNIEKIKAKTGTDIYNFSLGNRDKAIKITIFDKANKGISISKDDPLRVYGLYEYDEFNKEHILKGFSIHSIQKITSDLILDIKKSTTTYKRAELHVHTKMSTLDGVSEVKDYMKLAEKYNLESLTIMDHNSVQSFPDAFYISKESKIKINYGVEFDVFDDLNTKIVINERDQNLLDAEYVFFDLETTSISAFLSEIIEFGAIKYKNNTIIDRKQIFIKPDVDISEFTTSLTSITQADVNNAKKIHEVIYEIKEWIGDAILVAHNASFDLNFLNKAYTDNGLGKITNPVIDTMKLSWLIHPKSRAHRLGVLAKNEMITYDNDSAHRADYDAEILCKIFSRLLHKLLVNYNIRDLLSLNKKNDLLKNYIFTKNITLISKNQAGLKDINRLVSWANIKYFNKRKKTAMLPLSLFFDKKIFKNLLIGSSCSNGLLFNAIMDYDEDKINLIIEIYDYLEVMPSSSYLHLIDNNIISYADVKIINKKIIELGEKHNIPVVATSNAYYSTKHEKIFRDILISAQRVGGSFHPLYNFKNPNSIKPDAHLRTTEEMIEDFNEYLPKEKVLDIVINNSLIIQGMIEKQKPIKDKLYPPTIPGSKEKFLETIKENTFKFYGKNPLPAITQRIERELNPIIEHGFSIIYYLSAMAVKKSLDEGYLVGSRGSVGSSIAATLSGITEVNPLNPHYRCLKCKYHEFSDDADSGFDLETKECPVCKEKMIGDGHAIPFETFLGFNADKVPDIDLNFSRDNQSSIHLYIKELLGEKNIFRAGTISTAAFKTSIGYVKRYEELTNKILNKSTIEWMASKIEGGKRTSGQHPGGLIVIPSDKEVYDFTPINYPGDDPDADWQTTHFDFHSIHDNLLKLDLLGHLDPSTIRMLQNLTNINPQSIPMNDKEVISLFKSNKALKYIENFTGEELGTIGLPEFGTPFVRNLVREAKPESFADLVRVSGLSHGTNVWSGNAKNLIKEGIAVLSEVISVRDDILTYLIKKGMDESMAFNIMESVRKGKGITKDWEDEMRNKKVPQWYINSCKLIKYMFPKAHATAYVMMAYRIAWYKINYPMEYYATFFSKRDVEINLSKILKGVQEMKKHVDEIKSIPRFEKTKKDEDLLETYNVIFEMYSRGIEFSNIDINKSRSENYMVDSENKKIIPPFTILEGVGTSAAKNTIENRKIKTYESVNDFKKRSKLPKKVIELLEVIGVFNGIPKDINSTEQLSLFD